MSTVLSSQEVKFIRKGTKNIPPKEKSNQKNYQINSLFEHHVEVQNHTPENFDFIFHIILLQNRLIHIVDKKVIHIYIHVFYVMKQVVLSLAKILLQVTRPRIALLGNLPGTTIYRNVDQYPDAYKVSGVLIIRVDSAIYFSNANYIKERYVV